MTPYEFTVAVIIDIGRVLWLLCYYTSMLLVALYLTFNVGAPMQPWAIVILSIASAVVAINPVVRRPA